MLKHWEVNAGGQEANRVTRRTAEAASFNVWPLVLWVGMALIVAAFGFGVFTVVSFGASVAGFIS